jgi:SAM-dependent methyltransferase
VSSCSSKFFLGSQFRYFLECAKIAFEWTRQIGQQNILYMKLRRLLKRMLGHKKNFDYTDENHPEKSVLLKYCSQGRGIDVGCGHRKTHPNCIGIDIIPKGVKGDLGCIHKKTIDADICTSGDDLPMFRDEELDFVVSRHNLEHYVDVIKTLKEWRRVLKRGGILGVVLPDEEKVDTINLDRSHKHVFTQESYKQYLALIGGFEILRCEPVVPNWSFVCIARKN